MRYKATADVIVLGLGAYGSAALYQLARGGTKKVLGIDRFAPPHTEGSSHGESRITRLAIGEGEFYTPYALRSHEIWRELERESDVILMTKTGGLVIGAPQGSAGLHGKEDFFSQTLRAARRHKNQIAHEVLDTIELRRRYPHLAFLDGEMGYYEEDAGVLYPERCVAVNLFAAERRGATVVRDTEIDRIMETPHGSLELFARGGDVYACEKLVLAAGPWVTKMLPVELRALFRVTRQALLWFRSPADIAKAFASGNFPVFIWERESFYGFPDLGNGEIKVAAGEYGAECDPDDIPRAVFAETVLDMRARLSRSIPALSSAAHTRAATCLYTVTSDGNFVLDRHPVLPNILMVSACSGHGFKHSPAIGELAAKLVSDNTLLPPEYFSFKRFGTASA